MINCLLSVMDMLCYVAVTCIILCITRVNSEHYFCGDKLEIYDTTKSTCKNGHVIPLNVTIPDTPVKYLCGPSRAIFDPSEYDCTDNRLVLKKTHAKHTKEFRSSTGTVSFIIGFVLVAIFILTVSIWTVLRVVKKPKGNYQSPACTHLICEQATQTV